MRALLFLSPRGIRSCSGRLIAWHGVRGGGGSTSPGIFWDGPARNCPAGYWEGLGPLDLDAERESGRLALVKGQKAMLGEVLRVALGGLDEAEVTGKLEKMVEGGMLEPEAAAQIAEAILKG